MDEGISHKATVVSTDGQQLTVDVIPQGHDCTGCAIHSVCNVGSSSRLTIKLPDGAGGYSAGQTVTLRASSRTRLNAIVLLLVLPTLIAIAVAAIMSAIGFTEEAMAGLSLGVIALYFVGLYVADRNHRPSVKWIVDTL